MPSPFPGMNPYFERAGVWHDFHESFYPYARAELMPQIGPRYYTIIDENVYIHDAETDERRAAGRPDIGVPDRRPAGTATGATALAEPETVRAPEFDQESESYLRIVDGDSDELVTVIELLSPSNKMSGDNRRSYIHKRNTFFRHGVNLVEIDLLRGGPRMPMIGLGDCDYCVFVSRPQTWPDAGVWRFQLPDSLPVIRIPLRAGEPEASLDLKRVLDVVYDGAGYAFRIYDHPPEPPLSSDQADWAAQFIPANP